MATEIIRGIAEGTYRPGETELRQFPFIRTVVVDPKSTGNELMYVSHIKGLPSDELVMGRDEAADLRDMLGSDIKLMRAGLSDPPKAKTNEYREDSPRRILDSLGEFPMLTYEGARVLGRSIMAGQQSVFYPGLVNKRSGRIITDTANAAWDRLVTANRRLVPGMAARYRSLPYEDAHLLGELGLMHASSTFDYRKGFKFSTYARGWIWQSISRGAKHAKDNGTLSLNELVSEDGDAELQDFVPGSDGRDFQDRLGSQEMLKGLMRAISRLPEKHQQVFTELTVRHAIDGERESNGILSNRTGVSTGMISRINVMARAMILHPAAGFVAQTSEDMDIKRLDRAACKDEPLEVFFPTPSSVETEERRAILCGSCPVKAECESFAVGNNIRHGNWGDYLYRKPGRIQAA